MRLHTLSVTAFGPFGGTEVVDFDALGAAGLFLLHGPTGAGKTSVLDAVCFALYGQVPGTRHQARALRSHHSDPQVRPVVALETTVRGRRLRVTRSPLFERPKRRGTGTTTEPARVLLEELLGGSWVTRSTRADESGQLVTRLLGMTAAQFCQVVLLPQGQFAEFLRADADSRRDLLESLFDTCRFRDVEQWLVQRRRRCAGQAQEADAAVTLALARTAQAAGHAGHPEETADVALRGWAEDLGSQVLAEVAAAEPEVGRRGADLACARAAEAAASHLQSSIQRRAGVLARRDALAAGARRRALEDQRLAAATLAALVEPLLAELDRAEDAVAALRTVVDNSTLQRSEERRASCADAAALRGTVRAARAEAGHLSRLLADEAEASRCQALAATLRSEVAAAMQASMEEDRWFLELPERCAMLARARDSALEARAGLGPARGAVSRAAAAHAAGVSRDELAADLGEAGHGLRRAVVVAQQAREDWLDLRQVRLDGMAAELAVALAVGAACPVCGSDDHPHPAADAAGVTGGVSAQDEHAAQLRWHEADEDRRVREDEKVSLEHRWGAAHALAGGDAALGILDDTVASAQRDLSDAERRGAGLAAQERHLEDLERERRHREEQRRHREELVAAAGSRVVELDARARELLAGIDIARGRDASIGRRIERVTEEADRLELLAQALEELGAARRRRDEVKDRAVGSALDNGFPDLQAVQEAVLAQPERTRRADELESARRDIAAVEELLRDPALVAAADALAPDTEAARRSSEDAEAAHQQAASRHLAALARAEAVAECLRRLEQLMELRRPVRDEHRLIEGLSQLAEGRSADNVHRMSLAAYVLGARLEAVAAAASDRLVRMSGGRYTLRHTALATGARSRGGLGLEVLDAWTGEARDPATLSGGESFFTSLSLALGLADVVTAEAGGAVLETLFVDEGFGSLDEETLDEVMDVLDGLRDGGRVVGVVSHVPEMRARVTTRLTVTKGRHGSRLSQR